MRSLFTHVLFDWNDLTQLSTDLPFSRDEQFRIFSAYQWRNKCLYDLGIRIFGKYFVCNPTHNSLSFIINFLQLITQDFLPVVVFSHVCIFRW